MSVPIGGMGPGCHPGRSQVAAAWRCPRPAEQRDVVGEQAARARCSNSLPRAAVHQHPEALDRRTPADSSRTLRAAPGGRVIEADERIERLAAARRHRDPHRPRPAVVEARDGRQHRLGRAAEHAFAPAPGPVAGQARRSMRWRARCARRGRRAGSPSPLRVDAAHRARGGARVDVARHGGVEGAALADPALAPAPGARVVEQRDATPCTASARDRRAARAAPTRSRRRGPCRLDADLGGRDLRPAARAAPRPAPPPPPDRRASSATSCGAASTSERRSFHDTASDRPRRPRAITRGTRAAKRQAPVVDAVAGQAGQHVRGQRRLALGAVIDPVQEGAQRRLRPVDRDRAPRARSDVMASLRGAGARDRGLCAHGARLEDRLADARHQLIEVGVAVVEDDPAIGIALREGEIALRAAAGRGRCPPGPCATRDAARAT